MTRRIRWQDPYPDVMTGRYSDTVVASKRLESSKFNEPQLATRKDRKQAWTRARTPARTYALCGNLEEEERGDIERLGFCQLIYSYELAVYEEIFSSVR